MKHKGTHLVGEGLRGGAGQDVHVGPLQDALRQRLLQVDGEGGGHDEDRRPVPELAADAEEVAADAGELVQELRLVDDDGHQLLGGVRGGQEGYEGGRADVLGGHHHQPAPERPQGVYVGGVCITMVDRVGWQLVQCGGSTGRRRRKPTPKLAPAAEKPAREGAVGVPVHHVGWTDVAGTQVCCCWGQKGPNGPEPGTSVACFFQSRKGAGSAGADEVHPAEKIT